MASVFKKFLDRWKVIANKIAEFQTKVILSLLYFLVLGPTALIAFLFRSDLLKKRHRKAPSFWVKDKEPTNTIRGLPKAVLNRLLVGWQSLGTQSWLSLDKRNALLHGD